MSYGVNCLDMQLALPFILDYTQVLNLISGSIIPLAMCLLKHLSMALEKKFPKNGTPSSIGFFLTKSSFLWGKLCKIETVLSFFVMEQF